MGCNCGKPKCNGKCGCKSPAVLQINNPAEYITFHKVVIPASLGDSKTYPPRNGMYRNVLTFYESDQTSWLYSTDGIPTKLTNGITNYEDAINLPEINGNTLIGNKTGEELGLQDKLTAGENIQISDENVISATDTTYTAGYGLKLEGTEFSADEDVLATKDDLNGYYTKEEVNAGTDNLGVPEGFFSGTATEGGCGDTIELEDIIEGEPATLTLSGKTTQQTYTGRNLLGVRAPIRTSDTKGLNVSVSQNEGKIVFSGTTTDSWPWLSDMRGLNIPAGTYTFSIKSPVAKSVSLRLYRDDDTYPTGIGSAITAGNTSCTFTIDFNCHRVTILYDLGSAETAAQTTVEEVMLLPSGVTASFEPYAGAAASPNPNGPQPIRTVTGEQTVSVNGNDYKINLGKNLFNKSTAPDISGYVTGNGVIAAGGSTTYIPCSPNTTYTVSKTGDGEQPRFFVFTTNEIPAVGTLILNGAGTRAGADSTTSYTITTDQNASYLCIFYRTTSTSLTNEEIRDTIQIEENSVATPYAKYFEPVRLKSLGDNGEYTDYIFNDGDDWKVHRMTDRTTIRSLYSGDSFTINTDLTNTTRVLINQCLSSQAIYTPATARAASKTQYFSFSNNWSSDVVGFFTDTNSGLTKNGLCFRALKTTIGVIESDIETWLNNHPIEIDYVLANPVDVIIESPQVRAQLDEIRLATGANTITISSVGLTGSLCVSGYKDNWAGTIAEIKDGIETNRKVFRFKTAQDLQASANLKDGDIAMTAGYYTPNDGGAGKYYIKTASATADGGSVLNVGGGLKAFLIVDNDTINVKQFGAKGDGATDDSVAVRNALAFNDNNQITVKFVKGETYIVDGNFYIYSNTTMDLNDCTIKAANGPLRSPSYNNVQFMNNVESMTLPGYGAIKNFVVKNGTLNGNAGGLAFPLFHAQDCIFENIQFLNCFASGHVFDLGGCKNIIVRNSNFIGNLMNVEANNYREVIQPDHSTYTALPYWGNDPSFAFDDIPTDGLLVENCMFKKNDGDAYYLNAVGTHATHSTPVNNIVVRGCTFYDCQYSVIRLPYANNVLVEDNTFYNIRNDRTSDNFAINITNERSSDTQALHDIVVRGNKFISTQTTTDQVFIRVTGRTDYLTTGVVVEDNTYIGTSVSEADYLGNDCAHMYQLDGAIFRNNTVNKAKNTIYTGSSPLSNFKFVNNICNGCLRGCRSGATATDPTSNAFPAGFVWANNIWTTPVGAVDTSGARIVLGIDEDLVLTGTSDTTTTLSTKVLEGLPIYTTNTYHDIVVPSYFKKFRVTAVLKVQTASGSTVNYTRIQKYDRARTLAENTELTYNLDTAGEARSIYAGEVSVDYSNLAWSYFSTDAERLWVDGNIVMKVGLNTTGDVTVLAEGTKIILEAF